MNKDQLFRTIVCLLLSFSGTAHAYQVRVSASGPMTVFSDPDGLLPFGNPGIGATFSVSVLYETDSVDSNPSPTSGLYLSSIIDFDFLIDDIEVLLPSILGVSISQRHDTFHSESWGLVASDFEPLTPPALGLLRNSFLALGSFTAEPNSFLDNDILGLPPSFDLAIARQIGYKIFEYTGVLPMATRATALANITSFSVSVVPIPPMLPLVAGSLVIVGRLARARRPSRHEASNCREEKPQL